MEIMLHGDQGFTESAMEVEVLVPSDRICNEGPPSADCTFASIDFSIFSSQSFLFSSGDTRTSEDSYMVLEPGSASSSAPPKYIDREVKRTVVTDQGAGIAAGSEIRFEYETLTENNPAYEVWLAHDQSLVAYITSTLSNEALGGVDDDLTALELWSTLATTYSQLAVIGHPVSDKDKVQQALSGLGTEFDIFCTALEVLHVLPSFEDLKAKLFQHEASRVQRQNLIPSNSHNVLITGTHALQGNRTRPWTSQAGMGRADLQQLLMTALSKLHLKQNEQGEWYGDSGAAAHVTGDTDDQFLPQLHANLNAYGILLIDGAGVDSLLPSHRRLTGASRRLIGASCRRPIIARRSSSAARPLVPLAACLHSHCRSPLHFRRSPSPPSPHSLPPSPPLPSSSAVASIADARLSRLPPLADARLFYHRPLAAAICCRPAPSVRRRLLASAARCNSSPALPPPARCRHCCRPAPSVRRRLLADDLSSSPHTPVLSPAPYAVVFGLLWRDARALGEIWNASMEGVLAGGHLPAGVANPSPRLPAGASLFPSGGGGEPAAPFSHRRVGLPTGEQMRAPCPAKGATNGGGAGC
ncbi:hypothetical protein EJ110_NYTH59077 [Nymphaea thermarum]|nr:hypothetical protein EJ110_NYTH59077 [Nymphaea thermarum]